MVRELDPEATEQEKGRYAQDTFVHLGILIWGIRVFRLIPV